MEHRVKAVDQVIRAVQLVAVEMRASLICRIADRSILEKAVGVSSLHPHI